MEGAFVPSARLRVAPAQGQVDGAPHLLVQEDEARGPVQGEVGANAHLAKPPGPLVRGQGRLEVGLPASARASTTWPRAKRRYTPPPAFPQRRRGG